MVQCPGYTQGPNLYAYCLNRPLTFRDLRGLGLLLDGHFDNDWWGLKGVHTLIHQDPFPQREFEPLPTVDWGQGFALLPEFSHYISDENIAEFERRNWESDRVRNWSAFESNLEEKSFYQIIRDIQENKNHLDVFVIINGMCNTAEESRERALWLAEIVAPHPVVMVYKAVLQKLERFPSASTSLGS